MKFIKWVCKDPMEKNQFEDNDTVNTRGKKKEKSKIILLEKVHVRSCAPIFWWASLPISTNQNE